MLVITAQVKDKVLDQFVCSVQLFVIPSVFHNLILCPFLLVHFDLRYIRLHLSL